MANRALPSKCRLHTLLHVVYVLFRVVAQSLKPDQQCWLLLRPFIVGRVTSSFPRIRSLVRQAGTRDQPLLGTSALEAMLPVTIMFLCL